MTFTPFTTPEDALLACEMEGYQPLMGPDYPSGNRYSVCINNRQYETYFGDQQFLGWCNAHFALLHKRKSAGWEFSRFVGWRAPDGTLEADWLENGWPCPEDQGYEEWYLAAFHYDALDEGVQLSAFN